MKNVFKILSLIFCLFSLLAISNVLVLSPSNTFDIFYYAFCINLIMFPTFGFMTSGFSLHKLFSEKYFGDSAPQNIIKIYHFFRVDIFKKVVTHIPTKRLSKSTFFQDLEKEKEKSMISEIAHLLPFFVILIVLILFFAQKNYLFSLSLMLINIPLNVYPIILQRYNRHRINQLLAKKP